ncbi:RNA polymerase sigma factor [Pedobacter heparinus]|uniref:RNA polymerase sigma factor n=1 Tax=Pedobacter heparinus TaxID=984 RepID=UPI00293078AD|nr:sigma factor [Pedobacter heparinus]
MMAITLPTITDQPAIIQLVKNDESEFIQDLYNRYGAALFGIILRIVKSDELAEDVFQQTFLKIREESVQYQPSKTRIFTWAAAIARNIAIIYSSGKPVVNEDHALNTEEAVFKLIYQEGHTCAQVADKLGISVQTARTKFKIAVNTFVVR